MKQPSRSVNTRDAHIQQLLLPPDTQILEGMSKGALSGLEMSMKMGKADKKEEKRKALESLRGILPTDFTHMSKDKRSSGFPGLADFTKLLEAQGQSSKKSQEQQMREALEQFNKTNEIIMAKALAEEQVRLSSTSSMKRPREASQSPLPLDKSSVVEEDQPPAKIPKIHTPQPVEPMERLPTPQPQSVPQKQPSPAPTSTPIPPIEQEGVDIETLLPSSVVTSATVTPEKSRPVSPQQDVSEPAEELEPPDQVIQQPELDNSAQAASSKEDDSKSVAGGAEEADLPPKKNTKRRGKRKSGDILLDPEAVMEKKNLRSSASRSAAAAAARQQREAENAQRESENAS